MPSRYFILLLLWALPWRTLAQAEGAVTPEPRQPRYDTSYIGVCHDFITIKPILVFKSTQVALEDHNRQIRYKPNPRLHAGVEAAYKRLVLAVAFGVPGTQQPEAQYGATSYLDLRLQLLTRRVGVDVALYNYQGHYMDNPEQVLAGWSGGPMPQRPDLRHTSLFANGYYVFNHRKYTLRGALLQLEEQKRTAHSFVLLAGYQLLAVHADSSLVPAGARPDYQDLNPLKAAGLMNYAVAPGYAGAFVWGRFHFAPIIFLGPALQHGRWTTEDHSARTDVQLAAKLNLRGALYYRKGRWFTGGSFYYDLVGYNTPHARILASLFHGRMFFGYHFQQPARKPR